MTKINAICTDIDGTLLDSKRQLSPRTIAAVRKVNTIPVILASSRMPSAMRHLQQELAISTHPLICYNGGYVLQYKDGKSPVVYDSVFIPAEICGGIVELAKGTDIHVSLYYEDNWFAPSRDQWTIREETVTKVTSTILHPDEVISSWLRSGKGGHKVMCMGPTQEIDAMEHALHLEFPNLLHVYRSRDTYLEIAPRSISKGTALRMILEKLYNYSMGNVLAFGDNYNDIHLLELAGIGVAVENARAEAKAVANELTAKSIDDGVAMVIEKYFSLT
jgi:Cof subfamily protein (haloacid dehalogenase superfamily)